MSTPLDEGVYVYQSACVAAVPPVPSSLMQAVMAPLPAEGPSAVYVPGPAIATAVPHVDP